MVKDLGEGAKHVAQKKHTGWERKHKRLIQDKVFKRMQKTAEKKTVAVPPAGK